MPDYLGALWLCRLCSRQRLENELHKGPTHLFCNTCTTNRLPYEYVYNSKAGGMDTIQGLEVVVALKNRTK